MSILNPIILGEESVMTLVFHLYKKRVKNKKKIKQKKKSGEKIKKIYSNVDKLKIKMEDCLK